MVASLPLAPKPPANVQTFAAEPFPCARSALRAAQGVHRKGPSGPAVDNLRKQANPTANSQEIDALNKNT